MNNHQQALAELHVALGFKRLNPLWAKLEILLGLGAAGVAVLLAPWIFSPSGGALDWRLAVGCWFLFVLGGYLALAGHRSHLYRSLNDCTAYLAEKIRQSLPEGKSP